MTPSGRLVVDVDAHYFENPRAFAQYLDEPWRTRVATWTGRFFAPPAANSLSADGRSGGRVLRTALLHPEAAGGAEARLAASLQRSEMSSRDEVLLAMRYLGVDIITLLPGTMLGIGEITDKARAVALCNGFIDHMLDEVCQPSAGIYAPVVAPNQSPPDAAALIDRVADRDGVCAVAMMTDGPVLPLGDSYYDPIYDACCRHGLPLVLHSGYGGPEGRESGFGLQTYVENHLSFVLNNSIQLCSIVMQGVPERFPSLKLIFQEAGVFWIPMMMFRLDMDYAMTRSQVPLLRKAPSEYIRGFYFDTQPLERVPDMRYLQWVFEMIGGERCLMYASDWPHRDFDSPAAIERLSFLSDAGRAAILGGTAQEVFRFRGWSRAGTAGGAGAAGPARPSGAKA